jgi:hypothetical protein
MEKQSKKVKKEYGIQKTEIKIINLKLKMKI